MSAKRPRKPWFFGRKYKDQLGRNDLGVYCSPEIRCSKCHELKTAEETVGPYTRRICYDCVVLEWNRLKIQLKEAKQRIKALTRRPK